VQNRQNRFVKTVTVHDLSTSVTTATVTVTVGAGGSPPARVTQTTPPAPTKAPSPPPKAGPTTSFKVADTNTKAPPEVPPKQSPPKKTPPKQDEGNKPPKTTAKQVVKTSTSVATLTFTPGTFTTTRTSESEKTFVSVWTTAAPVTTTQLATVTVVCLITRLMCAV
jgi:hypothetical protein